MTKAPLLLLALVLASTLRATSLQGQLRVHDPSTVIECSGHYYVYATGKGIPILESDDSRTWKRLGTVFDRIPEAVRALSPKNDGQTVWAPDITHHNGLYYLYYSVSSWGSFVSAVGLLTSPTLDPQSPAYHWTDRGPVVNSVEGEALNAIDPGVLDAPDGRMWLCYGSYHGNIQLVELDPKSGLRISPQSPIAIIASHSEASDIIWHDGSYYLFVNHGSCCKGKASTYNIRVGRARAVTGPYLDEDGHDLARGDGTLFLKGNGAQVGPGHFGRIVIAGKEWFSCHYEADSDNADKSTLDLRPLLWSKDAWPQPGS